MAGPHGRYTKGVSPNNDVKDALTGQVRGGHAGGRTTRSGGDADAGLSIRSGVVNRGKIVVISAITAANPCVVTSAAHPFKAGMDVWISGCEGMIEINGLSEKITAVTTDTITLGNLNSTTFTAYSGSVGELRKTPEESYSKQGDTSYPGD